MLWCAVGVVLFRVLGAARAPVTARHTQHPTLGTALRQAPEQRHTRRNSAAPNTRKSTSNSSTKHPEQHDTKHPEQDYDQAPGTALHQAPGTPKAACAEQRDTAKQHYKRYTKPLHQAPRTAHPQHYARRRSSTAPSTVNTITPGTRHQANRAAALH